MVTINDILNYFESFAPLETAMDFDNCGLLVGGKNTPVTKALVSLDITNEVADEAKKLGCELIISHHPIIFNPIKRLSEDDAVYKLAANGISAVCMHTNLDLSEEFGVNTCLAEAVGLKNIKRSVLGECLFTGELEVETDTEAFVKDVKSALDCKGLRFTDIKSKIKKVALCSGAGGDQIFAAADEHADALLTGEIKHHEINAANSLGVNIIEAGHFKSEAVVILPLIKRLSAKFPDVLFTKSKTYDDFIKFA